MKCKSAVLPAFLGLVFFDAAFFFATTVTASAQTVKDVRSVLEASLKAMGGVNLKTIRYTGSGWSSRIGQTYGLAKIGRATKLPTTRVPSTTTPSGRARTTRAGRASIHFSAGHRCPRSTSRPF
jgi:hypothetical protein